MVVIAMLAIWAIHVLLLFVAVSVRIMDCVWLRRSVVVLGGRWGWIVRLIVDVEGMVCAILMALVFVIQVLSLMSHRRSVSMNV